MSFVSMNISIWNNKKADEIFCYKNDKSNEIKNFHFNHGPNGKDCFLTKTFDNDIRFIKSQGDFNPKIDDEILFRMRKSLKTDDFELINPIIKHKISRTNKCKNNYLSSQIWYPVKFQINFKGNNEDYILNENDIIKFGRVKYSVVRKHCSIEKENEIFKNDNFIKNNNINYISHLNKNSKSIFNIDLSNNQYKIDNNNDSINSISKIMQIMNSDENEVDNENENENKNETDGESESENEYNKCWICFGSESNKENPLLCLCNCHNFVHYECLKMQLSSKMKVYENSKKNVTTYECNKFNCDICLKPYHLRFRIPEFDKIYNLIDLTMPEETDYICLESLDYIIEKNNIKTLHIVQLNDEEITIGRKYYNDIINKDLTMSREHAVLKYNKNNGNLILENRNGRLGTLVLVRGNIKIKEEKTYFQIRNTYISMEVKNIKSFKNYNKTMPNLILDNFIKDKYIDSNNDDNNDC